MGMEKVRTVFLKALWQDLVMMNFEVDPSVLLNYLPPFTVLDIFNGKVLVSIVGFMFNNTTVFGLNWPYHTHFEEVNLRFYVKYFDGNLWKRGVVFVSEIVPSPIIAFTANKLYHEQYRHLQMKHERKETPGELTLSYQWKLGQKWNSLGVTAGTELKEIMAQSEEEFILEHYWGYNTFNKTTTVEYGVEHRRWQIRDVKNWHLDADITALYGAAFVPFLTVEPTSVFLANGSDVIIRKPTFIKKG